MRIALAQLNYHIGNFSSNIQKVKYAIQQSKEQGVELIIFAELAISGYPPRDFLEFDDFIDQCYEAINEIAVETKNIGVVIGCPTKNPEDKGKRLFNTAIFISDQKIVSNHHKALLPNYDIFDEYRYFEPSRKFEIIEYRGERIALTVCEDLWNIGNDPMYTINPMDELMKLNPSLMINIAASPFHYNQAEERKQILLENVKKYQLPLFYVNHVGAQTELLFDGGSLVVNKDAIIAKELSYFKEDFEVFDTNSLSTVENNPLKPSKMSLIHDGLVMGVKNYFEKLGFNKAILGLSGGIDSAVTIAIAAKALGAENVTGILLPSEFSSDHSIKDAEDLAKNLGCNYDTISIKKSYEVLKASLSLQFKDLPFNIAEENIQARVRGLLLMALSNKFGYILLNTSNKSEAAVGYGTLYGDMNGGLSVIGDVYKTEVFELARYINKDREVIPENTFVKPPSAELRPDQKDSDSLPDYDILDEILYQYIELRKGPKDLIKLGYEEKLVKRILKLVNTNEYKRYQTPPILRVSSKAFGMGRRMPIVAKYLS